MAVLQNAYPENIARGVPGMVPNSEDSNTLSRVLEGVAACAFGRPVYRGSGAKGVILTVSAGNLIGFTELTHGLPETATRPLDSYAPLDTMPVRERGPIAVACTTAAVAGTDVFVTPAGAVSNVSAGNTAATGWKFEETIAAAGVVVIVRR